MSGATGSIALHPLPLRQGLLLNRELDWLLGSPSNPPVSTATHPQPLEQRLQVSSPLACSASPLTPTEPSPGSRDSYFDPLSGFHLGKVNFTFRATILQNDLIWEWELPRAWAHKRLKVKTNLSCLGRLSRETKKINILTSVCAHACKDVYLCGDPKLASSVFVALSLLDLSRQARSLGLELSDSD